MGSPALVMRADASRKIGIGHVMRCLALAEAYKENGGTATFVGRFESSAFERMISTRGFQTLTIPQEASVEEELKIFAGIFGKSRGWCVLDGYHFSDSYRRAIKDAGIKVLIFDDLATDEVFTADILVNQNFGAQASQYKFKTDAKLLLGEKFVVLRKEFLGDRESPHEIVDVPLVLVTFGGADVYGCGLRLARALADGLLPPVRYRFILGPLDSNLTAVQELLRSVDNVECLVSVKDMMPHYMESHAAILCAGGTMWECFKLGLPVLTFFGNATQREIVESLGRQGFLVDLGSERSFVPQELGAYLENVLFNKTIRGGLQAASKRLIDGMGIKRIIAALE